MPFKKEKCFQNTVTFDASKNELLALDGLNLCYRKIVSMGYHVAINKGTISTQMLSQTKIFAMLCPCETLKTREIKAVMNYIKHGGKMLITATDGKELSNIKNLLKRFGIEFRSDAVIRMHRWPGYHYPKESVIVDGVVNEAIYSLKRNFHELVPTGQKSFRYLYPYGCTLKVGPESVVLLSTGTACFPFNRPSCALYMHPVEGGRLIAFGSTMAFSDSYINKEENTNLLRIIFQLLSEDDVKLNAADVQCPDVTDYVPMPDIETLAGFPYSCLQESEETPSESSLILPKTKLFQFDNRHVPKVLAAYKELEELGSVPRKLQIIKPKFESPLPELKPAIVPPRFRGLPNPSLELMDLDAFFLSPSSKLAQLSFKCSDNDLEYFITECGKMLLLPGHGEKSGKEILEYVCSRLVPFMKYYF